MCRFTRIISVLSFFAISLLLFSCTSKAEKSSLDTPNLVVEQDIPSLNFPKSEVQLPYSGNISAYNVRIDTLLRKDVVNADSHFGAEDFLPYIILPPKNDVYLLLNPINELGYARGYRLLTIKGNRVLSSLLVEAEWVNPADAQNTELITCVIDELYIINVQKVSVNAGLKNFYRNTYKITEDGFIVEEKPAEKSVDLSMCIGSPSKAKTSLNSSTLPSLDFQELSCEKNIEGMEEYSCYDGVLYRTLHKADDLIYLLIYSECGDSAFTDFVIVKNGKVTSGLTLDGTSEGYPTEYSLNVVTFDIMEDFSIKLTEKNYEDDRLVSTNHSSYLITRDGDAFVKQQNKQ